jgi:hypothetical protein
MCSEGGVKINNIFKKSLEIKYIRLYYFIFLIIAAVIKYKLKEITGRY